MSDTITKTNLSLNNEWFLNEIKDNKLQDFECCYPNGNDFVFKYSAPVLQTHIEALDALLTNHDVNFSFDNQQELFGKDLIISKVLDDRFRGYHFNSVDFKRHLVPEVALNKKVTRREDGRPEKAEYFIKDGVNGDTLVATIYFYFDIDGGSGLLNRRSEHLVYKKKDGSNAPAAVIKDKFYDMQNQYDAAKMLEERRYGRELVIDEIKATLLGVLSAANPSLTTGQVIGLGVQFFNDKDNLIKNFIDLGTDEFKNDLAAIDLSVTTYTWILTEVSPGINLRDYMVNRLTYTATSNHPEA